MAARERQRRQEAAGPNLQRQRPKPVICAASKTRRRRRPRREVCRYIYPRLGTTRRARGRPQSSSSTWCAARESSWCIIRERQRVTPALLVRVCIYIFLSCVHPRARLFPLFSLSSVRGASNKGFSPRCPWKSCAFFGEMVSGRSVPEWIFGLFLEEIFIVSTREPRANV